MCNPLRFQTASLAKNNPMRNPLHFPLFFPIYALRHFGGK
jgi:hypothetical protein